MPRPRRIASPLVEFLRTEAAGGAVLLLATALALAWANLPGATYTRLWNAEPTAWLPGVAGTLELRDWVNEGLMAVFFFVVGLEIKRELVHGELRDPRAAALPVIAAIGGMVVPAAFYAAVTARSASTGGWGIPMATDIAFAIGVLTVVSSRVPSSLKLVLLTLAIVDDLGAIAVIALFYSQEIELVWLVGAGIVLVAIRVMDRCGAVSAWWYVLPAVVVWWCTLRSGINPTIAGVALGLLTPMRDSRDGTPVEQLEHGLHPWSSYLVVPVFALANAGVIVSGAAIERAASSAVTWGVIAGLGAGKVTGIAGATFLAVRLGVARLPGGVRARHVVGLGLLGGIGFTVSLFVAGLAFSGARLQEAKLGVLTASLVTGIAGALVLAAGSERHRYARPEGGS